MFDWNDVRYFLEVARAGSTLAAARTLGVNQTTVARRIEALEEAIGHRLFDKTRTGRTLTEAGNLLLPSAEAVERAASQFGDQAASHGRGLAGSIRVTTSELLANIWLAPALVEFNKLYPQIAVELITADRFFDLTKGEADIAIRATDRPTDPGCVIRKLISVPWAVYCAQSYVDRCGMPTMDNLNDHVLIGGADAIDRVPPLQWIYRRAPNAEVRTRSNSLLNMYYSMKAGLGVGPLPVTIGDFDDLLVRCSEDIPELEASTWLIAPEHLRDVPRVRAFMDFVVPYMAALKTSGVRML